MNTNDPTFKSLEGLRERVVDLPESERKNQETAKEIQETLLGLVNEKNEKANAYEKTFKRRVDAKINRKELRQGKKEMKAKYGTTEADLKTATKHKEQYNKGDYKQILQGIRKSHKTEEDIRNEIFAIIKRAFNKNITLHQGSDIDKDASLFLLKVAGFFRDNGKKLELKDIIKEVPQGESGEKGLSIDTGGTISGIKVSNVIKKTDQGKTKNKSLINSQVIVSEHSDLSEESKKAERPTSSAHMIYYMLDKIGQLKLENKKNLPEKEEERLQKKFKEQLHRFMNFVDIVDSLDYQASGIDYANSYRTLFGLYRNLRIEDVYKYFEDPQHTGFEILSDNFLTSHSIKKHSRENKTSITEELSLKQISEKQKERVEKNIEQIKATQDKGQFGKFNNEMFHIALGDEISDGAQVASYYDCGLLKIFPSGDFYMFSPRILPKKILEFDTDGHFLQIRNISIENLKKLLEIFKFGPDDRLKDEIIDDMAKKLGSKNFAEDLKSKIIAYRESIIKGPAKDKILGNKDELKNIPLGQLKEGDIFEGIVNNVNGKNIFVYVTPTLKGLIKGEKKEKELVGGEKIKVKIKNISQGENDIPFISLERLN